jgi:hypothetical protein
MMRRAGPLYGVCIFENQDCECMDSLFFYIYSVNLL